SLLRRCGRRSACAGICCRVDLLILNSRPACDRTNAGCRLRTAALRPGPLNGLGMDRIKPALVAGKLDDPAIEKDLRTTLNAALPVFHRYFWPEPDRVNRVWIAAITDRVKTIPPEVIPRQRRVTTRCGSQLPFGLTLSGSATAASPLLAANHPNSLRYPPV